MKNAFALVAMLAAAPVAAQPAAPGPACAVTFVRAPDDVRTVVEQWVRAEPTCTTKLEIRIIATEGGLYLLARDENGRVRERVVPDAQSAGVLVASWVAADSNSAQTPYDVRQPAIAAQPPPAASPAALPPVVAPEGFATSPEALGPSAAPIVVAQPGRTATPKWLSLGGMFAMSGAGGGGIRGELDLKARKYATFGIAGSASTAGAEVGGGYYGDAGHLETTDTKLIGYVSVNNQRGRWHFRALVGAGVVHTQASLRQPGQYDYQDASGLFPTGEASLAIGRELGSRWMLYAAPVVTLYMQEYQALTMTPDYDAYSMQRRGLDAMMTIGVRHQL